MADIVAPDDINTAIVMLPLTQFPFGAACLLTREFQSLLFHFGIKPEVADILTSEDITSRKQVRFADPDGLADERALFDQISKKVKSGLQRLLLKRAFRRFLLPDPFAAVVATPASTSSAALDKPVSAPPTKKVKDASGAAVPSGSGAAKSSSKVNKRKDHDVSDSGKRSFVLTSIFGPYSS